MSVWMRPAARAGGGAARDGPRSPLLALARGEEGDQPQQLPCLADDGGQPGLAGVEVVAHGLRLVGVELRQLGLDAGGHRRRSGAARLGVLAQCRRRLQLLALAHVGQVEDGLGRERAEVAQSVRRCRRGRHRAGRAALAQGGHELTQPRGLGHLLGLARLGLAAHLVQPPLGLLEVGIEELCLDCLHVGAGVHAAFGVDDLRVVMRPDHVHQRVGLADVGQEAVAQPLALVRSAHQPRDVVELDRLVHDRRGANGRGHPVQSLVGDRHHRHVGLDGGERVVGRLGPGAGECVEERRLARVREPDDPDLHGTSSAIAVPSTAPAPTSVG